MDHPRGVPAIEGLQAFADPGAAAGALRHDREPVERAAGIPFLHRIGDMGQPGVKQKRFGLAKFIQHAVDEAQEYAGIHAHRAGGVEQHDEAQRLFLALPFDEVDRHAAMADIAVDGAPEIQPVAAPPRQVAPGQPGAHGLCQPRRGVVGLRDLIGVGQFAEIDFRKIVGARGAFHAAFAGAILERVVAGGRNLIGSGFALGRFGFGVPQILQGRAVGRLRRAHGQRARPHPFAQPERIEDAVEAVPVGFARREQMFQRRPQQPRPCNITLRHQRRRVLALLQADGEAGLPQGFQKRGEFCRDEF